MWLAGNNLNCLVTFCTLGSEYYRYVIDSTAALRQCKNGKCKNGLVAVSGSVSSKIFLLKWKLDFVIIIISTGDSMDLFEMAFFYGDYSALPTSDELFKNDEHTTTAEEILSWNANPILL